MTRIERFMCKVEKEQIGNGRPLDSDCCWNWTGSKSGSGYGQFWNGERNIPAHWFLLPKYPDDGTEACHHCDNKLCVRPSHIFIGTRSDNERDKVAKNRHNTAPGCKAMLKVRRVHRGVNNHECVLNDQQAALAKACPRRRGAATAMAKALRVSLTVICDIRDGKRWVHLPEPDATAAQRAEAFLHTLGLWKETTSALESRQQGQD